MNIYTISYQSYRPISWHVQQHLDVTFKSRQLTVVEYGVLLPPPPPPLLPPLPPLPSIDEVYFGEELLCGEVTDHWQQSSFHYNCAKIHKIHIVSLLSLRLTLMFLHRTDHSSNWGASNKPYIPKPSNRSACARFRMRRRVSRGPCHHPPHPESSPVNVSQLLQAKTEFSQELKHLYDAVLQQARVFSEHVLSCTSMANNIANIVAATPSLIRPLVQQENNDTLATLASPIPSACPSPSSTPSTSAFPPQIISIPDTPSHDSLPKTSTGIPSSLPRLRGIFNKSKTKPPGG